MLTGNKIVDAISRINFSGNMTPESWYHAIKIKRKKPGKTEEDSYPDLEAITILSDIVYWYRWREVRDEATGVLLRYEKKFKADLLQRSISGFVDKYGLSYKQAREALHRLQSLGVIKLIYRTVDGKDRKIPHVLFVELIPKKLLEITYPFSLEGKLLSLQGKPLSLEGGTYTKNTTETTTESINTIQPTASPAPKGADRETKKKGIDPLLRPFQTKMMGYQKEKLGPIPDAYTQAGAARWILEANHGGSPEQTFELACRCFDRYNSDRSIKFFKGWSSVRGYIGNFASQNGHAPAKSAVDWRSDFIDKLAKCSSYALTEEEGADLKRIKESVESGDSERQVIKNLIWESWIADYSDLIQLFADPVRQ